MNYILLCFMLLSCNIQEKQELPSLVNTKWEYKVAEGCISYIAFKADSTYEDYNCEMDYPFSGKYKVKNDTIYLIEIDLASNVPSVNEKNNYKKVIKSRTKGILKDEGLKFFDREDFIDGKWVKPDYKPTQEIFYKKVVK